jgi:hypothetical protein
VHWQPAAVSHPDSHPEPIGGDADTHPEPIADQGGMAARYTAYNFVPAAHILTSNLQFCVHEWGWNLPW